MGTHHYNVVSTAHPADLNLYTGCWIARLLACADRRPDSQRYTTEMLHAGRFVNLLSSKHYAKIADTRYS
jgi:hypothetical protein